MTDRCDTCDKPLDWFEIDAHWLELIGGWPVDCDDCSVACAMRAAIARGLDELQALAEIEKEQREARALTLARDRYL